MSAFFVGPDHINAMLTAAKALRMSVALPLNEENYLAPSQLGHEEWTLIGRMLMIANCASLEARYPTDWEDLLDPGVTPESYVFEEDLYFLTRHKLTDAIHLVRCYSYQCCEYDGWESSWAYRFCQRLLVAAAETIPESGKCWEYTKPANAPQIVSLSSLL